MATKIIIVDQNNQKLREIKRHALEVENTILNDLNLGDDTSLFFASKILEKLKSIEASAIKGKQKPNKLIEEINKLKSICTKYVDIVKLIAAKDIKNKAPNKKIQQQLEQKKVFQGDSKEVMQ